MSNCSWCDRLIAQAKVYEQQAEHAEERAKIALLERAKSLRNKVAKLNKIHE